jgi:hypothetical protein
MQLDLTDEETRALLNLLIDTIEADRYPNSPRIRLLQEILAKCGEVGGLSPELAARVRRHAPPAKWPTPEERDPSRRARQAGEPGSTFAQPRLLSTLSVDKRAGVLMTGKVPMTATERQRKWRAKVRRRKIWGANVDRAARRPSPRRPQP